MTRSKPAINHLRLSILLLLVMVACKNDPESTVPQDTTFIHLARPIKQAMLDAKLDSDGQLNGGATYGSIRQVDTLRLTAFDPNTHYTRLEGLAYFTNLTYLSCRGLTNQIYDSFGMFNPAYQPVVDTLDIRQNLKLVYLNCAGFSHGGGYSPSIRYLQTGANSRLATLIYDVHMQPTIDLSQFPSLEQLDFINRAQTATLSVCQNPRLRICRSNARVVYVASLSQVGDGRSWSPWVSYQRCP